MAEDGMLLNFQIGDAPLKPQIKFKGGRWRDRVKAQRSINKRKTGNTTPPERKDASNPEPAKDDSPATLDSSRPTKRQRIEDGSSKQGGTPNPGPQTRLPVESPGTRDSRPKAKKAANQQAKPHGVTSRLFTSNPAPRTVFEDTANEEAEPTKPSNAPLSEEAANFHVLGLSRRIAQHLSSKLEMKAPTAIQKNTIPQLVTGDSDAFLQAETGSGKTLAYLLPIVQRLMALSQHDDGAKKDARLHRGSGLFAVILAPTRELCKQIATVTEKLLRCAPWMVSTTVIGGESKKSEKARIRKGVNILIATPGRLTDHLDNTEALDVGTVRWLVLDEGDRLMEMGFEDDIRTIVGHIRKHGLKKESRDGVLLDGVLPSRRVTVLCSATMKMNVQKLGEISLQDAVHITGATAGEDGAATNTGEAVFAAPTQLKQSYIVAPAKLRLVTLMAFLKSAFARKGSVMKAIVFISCADSVDFHFDLLKSAATTADPADLPEKPPGLTASTVSQAAYITSPANPRIVFCKLHGSLPQPVRTSTLAAFTAEKDPAVLITTDISSRGLDVPAVDLVVEYDPAFSVDDHLHRIGRTARAGRPGKAALLLLPGSEEGYVQLLRPSTITPQLYDAVLQKGLSSTVILPESDPGTADEKGTAALQNEKQSWKARAEALQLHIEQRLLKTEDVAVVAEARANKTAGNGRPKDAKLLEAARNAFRSHIRAYATHVRDERRFFDMTQLHLGHTAKSFGLREAPGGIGGGVQRRTHRPAGTGRKTGGARGADSDDDGKGGKSGGDPDAARRMRDKMKAVMSGAGEFHIA